MPPDFELELSDELDFELDEPQLQLPQAARLIATALVRMIAKIRFFMKNPPSNLCYEEKVPSFSAKVTTQLIGNALLLRLSM